MKTSIRNIVREQVHLSRADVLDVYSALEATHDFLRTPSQETAGEAVARARLEGRIMGAKHLLFAGLGHDLNHHIPNKT